MAERTWKDDMREKQAHQRFLDNKKMVEAKEKLRWMYDQKDANAEEFLKGKKIDAKFLAENEDLVKSQSLKVFQNSDVNQDNEAFVKFHEDPLTIIKREEMKQRQQVMTNPLQLKQIQKEIDDLKKGKKKKSKKKSKKSRKHKKRKRSRSSSQSAQSSSSSDSYERKKRRKEKKAEEKRRRREEKRKLKIQKKKEEEDERKRKEIESLGPDPELYADRTNLLEEQSKLRQGVSEIQAKNEHKKMSKEELQAKADEMKERADRLERERDERYKTVLAVKETTEGKKLEEGMQPKFVNDISKSAYVDHSMDLADSINRKKHYNQRMTNDM